MDDGNGSHSRSVKTYLPSELEVYVEKEPVPESEVQSWKRLYDIMDGDGNGSIDADELGKFLTGTVLEQFEAANVWGNS